MSPRRSFLIRHVKNIVPDRAVLERFLLHWHTGDLYNRPHDFPKLTSESLFDNTNPLELEIGCGTGEFLCKLAEDNPGRNYIGLDTNLKSLYIAVHEAAGRGLGNLRFIKASVQYVYPLLVRGSLRAVYLHFPEPILWPKFRKRRIVNSALLENLGRALAPGGILSIITDSEELFEGILAIVEGQSLLKRTHAERFLVGYEPEVKSRYQEYWEGLGVTIYRLELATGG